MKAIVVSMCMLAAGSASPAEAGPVPAPAQRRLNNLVTELLETTAVSADGMKFVNPREGWVFFRSRARVGPGGSALVSLDGRGSESRIIAHELPGPEALEAMRYLPEGEHTVFAVSQGEGTPAAALTVRASPEIIYANYPLNPHLKEYGAYDWPYLRRIGMLDCANCYDHHIEKYGDKNTYFNFFRRVFRARSPVAELTISDWASQSDPGGPAGQELLCNFVEIEPYLPEDGERAYFK